MTELFSDPSSGCRMTYQESASQAADIFTKPFTDPEEWHLVCSFIGLRKLRLVPKRRRESSPPV